MMLDPPTVCDSSSNAPTLTSAGKEHGLARLKTLFKRQPSRSPTRTQNFASNSGTVSTLVTSQPSGTVGASPYQKDPTSPNTGNDSAPSPIKSVKAVPPLVLAPSPVFQHHPDSVWQKALQGLPVEDRQALNFGQLDNKLDILNQVIDALTIKRDNCIQKQWKFTHNGKTIILRDVADKLLTWVDKFKEIGDIIVQYDPVHAALPWAGFRFLLQVCVPSAVVGFGNGARLVLLTNHSLQ